MVRESWAADGFVLTDGIVRDVEYRDGLYTLPTTRGSPTIVAGRHGSLPGRRRKFGPGSFVLHLWAGAPPGGVRADVEAAYDNLIRALNPPHRLVTFTRGLASGAVRECQGRVTSPVTPRHLGQLAFRLDVEIEVPGSFWTDVAVSTETTPAGAALPKDLLLNGMAGATAPMGDLIYRITGPIPNPTVTVTSDPELSDSFTYAAAVPAGQVLEVDAGAWTALLNGVPVDWTKFSWTGERFLEVPAAPPGVVPAVRLSGTGAGGATTQLEVAGRASYLC